MGKGKYRFCVGDKSKHSGLVTIIQIKNDIYIVSSACENQTKLSIHESGQCQYSFTAEYVVKSGVVKKNQDRHLMKLQLLPLSDRYEVIESYLYPVSELVLDDEILKENVKWISTPRRNQYVEVIFCRTGELNPCKYDEISQNYSYLYTIMLDNRTFFVVLYRYLLMDDKLRNNIMKVKEFVRKNKEENMYEDRVCASYGFEDEEGHRFSVEVHV